MDGIENDVSERDLSGEEAQDLHKKHRHHIKVGNDAEGDRTVHADNYMNASTQSTHRP